MVDGVDDVTGDFWSVESANVLTFSLYPEDPSNLVLDTFSFNLSKKIFAIFPFDCVN